MPPQNLSSDDIKALEEIRRILTEQQVTNWVLPEKHAMFAQDLVHDTPAVVSARLEAYIKGIRTHNLNQRKRFDDARKFKQAVISDAVPEITNAGQRGIIGYLWRSFLATLNGTPLSSLNFFEITKDGLLVEQPFATVSRRVFKFREIANNEITMSVNPPVYLDWLLGFLRQFFRKVTSPWGEIVIYERGSGREIARAVALWPERKIKEIRDALEKLFLADNEFAGREREPKKIDLLGYYVEHLREIEDARAAQMNNIANQNAQAGSANPNDPTQQT